MRVLVTWGSKSGGTEGIGRVIAEELGQLGFDVTAAPVAAVKSVKGFDAAIVGGALYAGLWHAGARRFVCRHLAALRRMPVFLFASGPLDDSAEFGHAPASEQLDLMTERVGALRTVIFGGRLAADARGFPASAMAKTRAGDWRNLGRVRRIAGEIGEALPTARPGVAHEPPARSPMRLLAHGLVGWGLCAATMGALMASVGEAWAIALHLFAAPLIFWGVSRAYFRPHGAREPLATAVAFTALVAALDAGVIAPFVGLGMLMSPLGFWLPLGLIFGATYATGQIRLMAPPRPAPDAGGKVAAPGA